MAISATPFARHYGAWRAAWPPSAFDVNTSAASEATSETFQQTKKSLRKRISEMITNAEASAEHPKSLHVCAAQAAIEKGLRMHDTGASSGDAASYAATVSRKQVDRGEDVGFAADWVCRKQGGVENLGSLPPEAP